MSEAPKEDTKKISATSSKKDPTKTSMKTFRKSGEIFAVPFPHKKSGYKKDSTGPRSETTTTYRGTFQKPLTDRTKKPLSPYKPGAIRSRLPVHFEKEAVPFKRYCAPRNVSQFTVKDGARSDSTRFVTTAQRTFIKHEGVPVGFQNQGIVAEKTRWLHKRMQD